MHFPHKYSFNHRSRGNRATREIIRSVSLFFCKVKSTIPKNRTCKLAFSLMCSCLSLFFMLWCQKNKKRTRADAIHISNQQQTKYFLLRLVCKTLQITVMKCEGCTKNEESPPNERNERCEMSDLLDAVSTSSHESFSEKLTLAHKSKAGGEETEAEIK